MTTKRSHRRADSIEPDAGSSERSHDAKPKRSPPAEDRVEAETGSVDDNDCHATNILEDLTQELTLHSKRTGRRQKKLESRARKPLLQPRGLLDLPYELLMRILALLRPSDLFALVRVNKDLGLFIRDQETRIADAIIALRYPILAKCFRRPVLIEELEPGARSHLHARRLQATSTKGPPFQHIRPLDPALICSCLTCLLRWNSLCIVLDFAHWQPNLDKGEPIPVIARGRDPQWNQNLVAKHAEIVVKSLTRPLCYARILEAHLDSTTRAIRRHAGNKGNRRRRYRMTDDDLRSGSDAFLGRSGPPTLDIPFHRDNYYMLEAFFPNRSWIKERDAWVYVPEVQHEQDLARLLAS
ncbi:hypothetical protein QBC39DRAFT_101439 [Podospora conica]|nr:hypothetical protein QBC39DRAFT_101439 [Schizothecium conicum]